MIPSLESWSFSLAAVGVLFFVVLKVLGVLG